MWTGRSSRKLLQRSLLLRGFSKSAAGCPEGRVLAIRREESSVWERRAPLSPSHVQALVSNGVKVLVQSSSRRAYSKHEYEAAGAVMTDDISEADTILGVKQVPVQHLLPDKTYAFFSHTIKAQPDNMPLLDALLEKRVRLVDYERILDNRGVRMVAFGQYAGITGMINILHGLGLKLLALGHHTPFMHIGAAHNYPSSSAAKAAIANLGREIQYGLMPKIIGPMIFTFTGAGNVSQGAQSVFKELPHEYVSPDDLREVVEKGDTRKVYATVVDKHHHLVRKSDGGYNEEEFLTQPDLYKATFSEKVAPYTTCLINGVFWVPGTPRLLTLDQAKQLHPPHVDSEELRFEGVPQLPQRLLAIADISCDISGSLEFMKWSTTIDDLFVVYNAHTEKVSNDIASNGIVLMTVDNLPAQIPREATDFFGSRLLPLIHDFLRLDGQRPLADYDGISDSIRNAVITYNGNLTDNYKYIADLRKKTN
ncbi:alpha-aminoadipic semialdehyde synthase, mitochondrial-like [Halichondria panicea]|uniref:alpha-aminoadipic semialdehyde synthase, mitochondrial-like n=1 Tax=Halichondria panicea TaxID=6063 RepID=UPI00312B67DF